MRRASIKTLLPLGLLPGCTQYPYAKNVKMLSYEDNVMVGKAVGPVRGQSCQAHVKGCPIGEPATLDEAAVTKAQRQSGADYISDVTISQKGDCVLVEGEAMK